MGQPPKNAPAHQFQEQARTVSTKRSKRSLSARRGQALRDMPFLRLCPTLSKRRFPTSAQSIHNRGSGVAVQGEEYRTAQGGDVGGVVVSQSIGTSRTPTTAHQVHRQRKRRAGGAWP